MSGETYLNEFLLVLLGDFEYYRGEHDNFYGDLLKDFLAFNGEV